MFETLYWTFFIFFEAEPFTSVKIEYLNGL